MNLQDIVKKYKEFKEVEFKKHEDLFLELVEKGQSPKVLFIGCSDSRVVPSLITKTKPGDLFIFRNIGNFVPPYKPDYEYHATAAAIEYAVSVLNVEDIIVCGHSYCGACESLYKNIPNSNELIHVKKWLEIGEPVKKAALELIGDKDKYELLRATEKLSVILQLENLLTYPGVKRRVEKEELFLHGWYYKIEYGEIEYYDCKRKDFFPLSK